MSDASELEKTSARIYARTEQERDSLLSALERIGVTFKKFEDLPAPGSFLDDGKALVEITFTINDGIRRCVAKYAFNYSTFVCGADFMMGSDFDATRRFVRYGETPSYPVVVERFKPILHDDLPTGRQTDGHLITITWSRSGVHLVAQVSLFNYITYSISLARHYSGPLWRPIRSGVHFNIATKTVEPLTGISGSLMPRRDQRFGAFPIRK